MDRSPLDRASGFTLIEVLVAMALAAGMAAGAAVLISTAATHALRWRIQTVANFLTAQKVEHLVAQAGSSAFPTPGGSTETNVPGFFEFLDPTGAPDAGMSARVFYVRRWHVRQQDNGTCLVRVAVWMPRVSGVQPARLSTLACRGGL